MNKPNYLYGIIGLLAGLIIGYIGTNYINQTNSPAVTANNPSAASSSLPPDHPPTGAASGAASGGSESGPQGDVMAVVEQARNEPANFDAQMQAAELFKQINRPEGALGFYERAFKVRPKDSKLLVALGDTNFDMRRYEEAERWYRDALKVDPRHEKALQNLTQALIDKGDKPGASESLKRLEQVNPNNQGLALLRSQLQ